MFSIVLVTPEIPPNTGNVIRLAANTGCRLHLIEPLGFAMTDPLLRRAGLDYHELTSMTVHRDWSALRDALSATPTDRWFAATTRGARSFDGVGYRPGDVLVFGRETTGLPDDVLAAFPDSQRIRVPMRPEARSLNLSNAVAIVVYEAWRQQGYAGAV